MADISRLSRLLAGVERHVDLAANSLVVGSLKVGSVSPTELTKAILDRLVSLQNGTDVDATYHTHDGRYFTETELSSATSSSGSDLIGDDDTYSNFTPAAATVKGALAGIDSALASAGSDTFLDSVFRIQDNSDPTKEIAFEASAIATGTTRTISMPDEDVDLGLVSSAIQSSEKGANNGVATLDAGGKIPVAQLPNSVMTYEGTWDASTNTPTLADGTGDAGMVYLVTVAGTVDFGAGNITFAVGDWVVYSGSIWQKSTNSNAVVSVNGQTGIVSLDTDDIAEGSALYFTDARARTATIASSIVDGDTTHAPSGEAVYEALLLKQDASAELDEAEAFFAATDITGAEAEELTDGSIVDTLHTHVNLKGTHTVGDSFASGFLWVVRWAKAGDPGFTAGRLYKAHYDATSADNFYVVGLIAPTSALSAGDPATVVKAGPMTVTGHGYTVGEPIYLRNDGLAQQAAPSADNQAVVRLGIAIDANTIDVQIQVMGVN